MNCNIINTTGELPKMIHSFQKYGIVQGNPVTAAQLQEGARHCAFCLAYILKEEVKTCAKCHKRAYCSKECQVADWKPKGKAQGHKNWCSVDCGEEDVDWELFFTEDKGTGIRAKRLIPPNYRIIVEGFDRAIDLSNAGAACSSVKRATSANHNCDANACQLPWAKSDPKGLEVYILFSRREIQAGEEICTNYTNFNEPNNDSNRIFGPVTNVEESRALLEKKWGIICPPDCFCRRPEISKRMKESKTRHNALKGKSETRMDAMIDLKIVEELLQDYKVLHYTPIYKSLIHQHGFRIAVQQKHTLDLAVQYAKEAYEFARNIFHPQAKCALEWKALMNNPKSHDYYLKLEKPSGSKNNAK